MKRREAIDRAIEIGKQDRAKRLAIQNHYAHDDVLHEAYLRGYDPNGEIVKYKKTTLRHINADVDTLANIEYVGLHAISQTPVVFVDDMGNQYEYDGVCISEGKLKIAIKSNKSIEPLPRIQRKYFNFENEITVDMLPFNQDTLEKIRLERECMEKDVEGSIMNRSQIWHYLSNGFTITTYQADYVIEGENFSYDEK